MEFFDLAQKRFAARGFLDKKVEDDKLNKVLEAGRIAPTAKNNQPQVIYVLRSEEALKKINEVSPCIFNSTTVLMICCNTDLCWHSDDLKYDSQSMDASIVCTHMMLEATDLGLDSCWVLRFDREKATKLFNLPGNIKPQCLLPIGYKKEDTVPSPRHFDRKPLSETVIEL